MNKTPSNQKKEGERPDCWTIRQIAPLLRVPYYTLHYWQKKFAVKPCFRFKRKFFFDATALEEFRQIKYLIKKEGYSLSGARKKMELLRKLAKGRLVKKENIIPFIKKEISEAIEILDNS